MLAVSLENERAKAMNHVLNEGFKSWGTEVFKKIRRRYFNVAVAAAIVALLLRYTNVSPIRREGGLVTEELRNHTSRVGVKEQQKPEETTRTMTVLITTYKQPRCVERQIQLLVQCPVVSEIRFNWFEDEDPSLVHNSLFSYQGNRTQAFGKNRTHAAVVFDRLPNKLSHRFEPRNFSTDAIFSVDVDTFYTCDSVTHAFRTWTNITRDMNNEMNSESSRDGKTNELLRHVAVGFHGRFVSSSGKYKWNASYKSPFRFNTLFVTKGGIVHRDAYHAYFQEKYSDLREKIDAYTTAEDMLMSFVLAHDIKARIVMVCTEKEYQCSANCKQNGVGSLRLRTGQHRTGLAQSFVHFFSEEAGMNASAGNFLTEQFRRNSGKNDESNIVWHGLKGDYCNSGSPNCAATGKR